MRLILFSLFFLTTAQAFAYPVMSTKERVRLELWFHGISNYDKKIPAQKKVSRPLPVELEQALSKF